MPLLRFYGDLFVMYVRRGQIELGVESAYAPVSLSEEARTVLMLYRRAEQYKL